MVCVGEYVHACVWVSMYVRVWVSECVCACVYVAGEVTKLSFSFESREKLELSILHSIEPLYKSGHRY